MKTLDKILDGKIVKGIKTKYWNICNKMNTALMMT